MVFPGQAGAGEGVLAAILAVKPVMYFLLGTVAAGDQQVLAKRQQLLRALIGAALGQLGENTGLRKVGGDQAGQWHQLLAHGVTDFILTQRATTSGAQYRVADQR